MISEGTFNMYQEGSIKSEPDRQEELMENLEVKNESIQLEEVILKEVPKFDYDDPHLGQLQHESPLDEGKHLLEEHVQMEEYSALAEDIVKFDEVPGGGCEEEVDEHNPLELLESDKQKPGMVKIEPESVHSLQDSIGLTAENSSDGSCKAGYKKCTDGMGRNLYKCSTCLKMFTTVTLVKKHQRPVMVKIEPGSVHSLQDPIGPTAQSSSDGSCKSGYTICTDEMGTKLYKCSTCLKMFTTKALVREHQQVLRKRKRSPLEDEPRRAVHSEETRANIQEDEYEIFAKYLASELRKIKDKKILQNTKWNIIRVVMEGVSKQYKAQSSPSTSSLPSSLQSTPLPKPQ